MEEYQLRFFAGEFGEDEFKPQQETYETTIATARNQIGEIQKSISEFKKHLAFISGEPFEEEPVEEVSAEAEPVIEDIEEDLAMEPGEEPVEEPVEEEGFFTPAPEEADDFNADEPVEAVEGSDEDVHDFLPEHDEIDLSSYETAGEGADRLMKDTVNETLFPSEQDAAEPVEVQPEKDRKSVV